MIEVVPNLTVRPYAVAVDLRARALEAGGTDGILAYNWFVTQLFASPGATQTQAQNAYTSWSNANGCLIHFANWVKWCINRLPAGYSKDWAGLKSFILSKSVAAWMGEPTELSDGYRVSGDIPSQDFRGKTLELVGQARFQGCPMDSTTTIITNGYGFDLLAMQGEPGTVV